MSSCVSFSKMMFLTEPVFSSVFWCAMVLTFVSTACTIMAASIGGGEKSGQIVTSVNGFDWVKKKNKPTGNLWHIGKMFLGYQCTCEGK